MGLVLVAMKEIDQGTEGFPLFLSGNAYFTLGSAPDPERVINNTFPVSKGFLVDLLVFSELFCREEVS